MANSFSSRGETRLTSITGSRRRDAAIIALLLLLLFVSSRRLRVYYRVTVVEIRLAKIAPGGARHDLPTPIELRRTSAATALPEATVRAIESSIGNYMRRKAVLKNAAPGTRYKWTIRYADNSTRLNKQRILTFEK